MNETLERHIVTEVTWRLIPLLCLCFMAAFLDRVNVSFAKLTMVTGTAAGIGGLKEYGIDVSVPGASPRASTRQTRHGIGRPSRRPTRTP